MYRVAAVCVTDSGRYREYATYGAWRDEHDGAGSDVYCTGNYIIMGGTLHVEVM